MQRSAVAGERERVRAQEVGRPWLAGRPQPLSREVTLPEALRASALPAYLILAQGDATAIAAEAELKSRGRGD